MNRRIERGRARPQERPLIDPCKGSQAEQWKETLETYMAEHGLRATEARRVIIEAFMEAEPHLNAEQLLALVRSKDAGIGYATVYRTLRMLAQCGIAQERHFSDGAARYEVATAERHHDHLICSTCGTIVEFEAPAIEALQLEIAANYGFTVSHHRHELYGQCAKCRESEAKA
jgi:Fur family ferric uptake transcriptional regulator